MKKIEFKLCEPLMSKCFPHHRIKDRKEIINILMEVCRYIICGESQERIDNSDKVVLKIDKMSRLFFCCSSKMYSIVFPFTLIDSSLCLKYGDYEISSSVISCICGLLSNPEIESESCLDFFNLIDSIDKNFETGFWKMFKNLMTYEIGYIRYDDDITRYLAAKKSGRPKSHPRFHYDVNIASNATYKIGLKREIGIDEFIKFLDVDNDVKHLLD